MGLKTKKILRFEKQKNIFSFFISIRLTIEIEIFISQNFLIEILLRFFQLIV